MKRIRLALVFALTTVLAATCLAGSPSTTVGLISKVIADVAKKQEAGQDWQKARRGESLTNGDRIRTGEKSMAIIKFMDNSLVRVREQTEVTVTGAMNGSNFQKSVDIRTGVIGFTVQKQHAGEQFKFTSPTSVASIRGTGGSVNSTGSGDTLTVLEGIVSFQNRGSNQSTDVQAGFTGISLPDGSITSRPSTDDERRRAENSLRGETQKTLEFDLRDSQGRPKRLKIEYKD